MTTLFLGAKPTATCFSMVLVGDMDAIKTTYQSPAIHRHEARRIHYQIQHQIPVAIGERIEAITLLDVFGEVY